MEKFKIKAKLASVSIGGGSYDDSDRSGAKFKLTASLDALGDEMASGGQDIAKSVTEKMPGKISLKCGETRAIKCSSVHAEYNYEKQKLVIYCEASERFNEEEIVFLNEAAGQDVTASWTPGQKQLPFDGKEDESEAA